MRIVTWNVNSLKARLGRVESWIQAVEPDVLCIQETKMTEEAFPHETFSSLGYESAHHGEGRWNGDPRRAQVPYRGGRRAARARQVWRST